MKLLVDMNLSPLWCAALARHGLDAIHWSTVGDARAPDHEIMAWARANGRIVFTHDLDFGAMLAATRVDGPSVIQVRSQDTLPSHLEGVVVTALRQFESELERGALVVVDEARARVRLLPLR